MTTAAGNELDQVRSADGTAINFELIGSGPAVILVDPAPDDAAGSPPGGELKMQLATAFAVYSYERRGRTDGATSIAVEQEIDDLAALITYAGGSACLYGATSGALLALQAAAAGLPISRLAVFAPPIGVDDADQASVGDLLRSVPTRTLVIDGDGTTGESPEWAVTAAATLPDVRNVSLDREQDDVPDIAIAPVLLQFFRS